MGRKRITTQHAVGEVIFCPRLFPTPFTYTVPQLLQLRGIVIAIGSSRSQTRRQSNQFQGIAGKAALQIVRNGYIGEEVSIRRSPRKVPTNVLANTT
jgi:hypothetical protein